MADKENFDPKVGGGSAKDVDAKLLSNVGPINSPMNETPPSPSLALDCIGVIDHAQRFVHRQKDNLSEGMSSPKKPAPTPGIQLASSDSNLDGGKQATKVFSTQRKRTPLVEFFLRATGQTFSESLVESLIDNPHLTKEKGLREKAKAIRDHERYKSTFVKTSAGNAIDILPLNSDEDVRDVLIRRRAYLQAVANFIPKCLEEHTDWTLQQVLPYITKFVALRLGMESGFACQALQTEITKAETKSGKR